MISLLYFVLMVGSFHFASGLGFSGDYKDHNCTLVEGGNITLNADIGWPYQISCRQFVLAENYSIYEVYENNYLNDDDTVECSIYDVEMGNLLLNKTTSIENFMYNDDLYKMVDDLTGNRTYTFEINVIVPSINQCYAMYVTLNTTPFQQITCMEYVKTPDLWQIDHKETNQEYRFECQVSSKKFPKLYALLEDYDVNVTWSRNCIDSNIPGTHYDISDVRNLIIPSVKFEHAGVYVCAATYKRMTKYIAQYPMCVKHKPSLVQHTISCAEDVQYVSIGQNVILKCELRLGVGDYSRTTYLVYWNKASNNVDEIQTIYCNHGNIKPNERAYCHLKVRDDYLNKSGSSEECFKHVISEKKRKRKDAIVHIYLHIKNVISSDYGNYVIKARTNLDTAHDVNDTITLEENVIKDLRGSAYLLSAIVVSCLLALTLFIVVVVCCKKNYFPVYYKRYFGDYDRDDKEYSAYITYHYSQELDKFAKDETDQCVRSVIDEICNLGHKVYDEHQDFTPRMKAVQLQESIKQSHRVVIILTLQYINDDWGMRNLQQAFQEMIKSGKKLVFIMVPGIKEYVKQHAHDADDACCLIQKAIDLNYIIHWSKDKKSNSKDFKLRIEYVMPKLFSHNHSMKCAFLTKCCQNGEAQNGKADEAMECICIY